MSDDSTKMREDVVFDALWDEMERQAESGGMGSPYMYVDDKGMGVSGVDGQLDLRAMARAVVKAIGE